MVTQQRHRFRRAAINARAPLRKRPAGRYAAADVPGDFVNMDPRLATLIGNYLAAVAAAVKALADGGIERPSSDMAWACNGMPQTGFLAGGVKYFKHGFGCAVHLHGGLVDFDFGKNGETHGFDAWRLASFAEGRLAHYGFVSEGALKACFDAEVAAGSLLFSGYILYCVRDTTA